MRHTSIALAVLTAGCASPELLTLRDELGVLRGDLRLREEHLRDAQSQYEEHWQDMNTLQGALVAAEGARERAEAALEAARSGPEAEVEAARQAAQEAQARAEAARLRAEDAKTQLEGLKVRERQLRGELDQTRAQVLQAQSEEHRLEQIERLRQTRGGIDLVGRVSQNLSGVLPGAGIVGAIAAAVGGALFAGRKLGRKEERVS